MKASSLIILALAALGVSAGVVPLHAAQEQGASPAAAARSSLNARDWADCTALKKRLAADIQRKLRGTDAESVKSFMASRANRLLLAQWHVANCVDSDELQKLLETASPRTLKFVQRVTQDVAWMEQLAYTGECVHAGRMMAILATIAAEYEGMEDDRVLRDIATATALEWARWDWVFRGAVERAGFYIRNHREGRFHKGFSSLPFWHYRVIGGSKGNNANGSVASLEWALDNMHLPVDQYPGSCWYAAYLTTNLFGDSIHGAHYYAPYAEVYGDNALLRTLEVGGVCGSLSHFGAFSALANGVPALPAGEPGHCAYIVNVNGKWVPSYSLSWERGLHWQVWNDVYKFSSLHMKDEMSSAKQAEATAFSNACRSLAELYAAAGQEVKALACYRQSVKAQPRNYPAWRSYAAFLRATRPDDAAAWKHIYKDISKRLAPHFPEMAAEILLTQVHAGMHRACKTSAERMECYAAFWKAVDGMGPDRWAIEALCHSQSGSLQDAKHNEAEARLSFYKYVLGYTSDKAVYAPVILAWGNGIAARQDEKMQKRFLRATLEGLSKGKGGKMDAGARDRMLGQAIAGAERMRDRKAFQTIGNMLSEKYRKSRIPGHEPFPGKLVSQEGMIYMSSSAHDDPAEHWGVLQPCGGRFHSDGQKDPWVVVELPRTVYVTGVVAVSTAGWLNNRIRDMRVEYSESGRDDDWHEAGAFPAPSTHEISRLDLRKSKPRARFIRIMRGGKDFFFHLNGIFVYGKQAS